MWHFASTVQDCTLAHVSSPSLATGASSGGGFVRGGIGMMAAAATSVDGTLILNDRRREERRAHADCRSHTQVWLSRQYKYRAPLHGCRFLLQQYSPKGRAHMVVLSLEPVVPIPAKGRRGVIYTRRHGGEESAVRYLLPAAIFVSRPVHGYLLKHSWPTPYAEVCF